MVTVEHLADIPPWRERIFGLGSSLAGRGGSPKISRSRSRSRNSSIAVSSPFSDHAPFLTRSLIIDPTKIFQRVSRLRCSCEVSPLSLFCSALSFATFSSRCRILCARRVALSMLFVLPQQEGPSNAESRPPYRSSYSLGFLPPY